jgi:hypothetical protein
MDHIFENDFSNDFFRWLKFCESKKISHLIQVSPSQLEYIQNEILQSKDYQLAYFFALEFSFQNHKMQKLILDCNDPKYAFIFALNIKNADIKSLQKIVLDSKNIKYICKFACFIPSSYLPSLEKFILSAKNPRYAYLLIKNNKRVSFNKYKQLILNSDNPLYLFELAKNLNNIKDITFIEDKLISLKAYRYIRLMAAKFKNCNIEKLEKAILESNNVEEIKKFAKSVKKSSIKQFLLID